MHFFPVLCNLIHNVESTRMKSEWLSPAKFMQIQESVNVYGDMFVPTSFSTLPTTSDLFSEEVYHLQFYLPPLKNHMSPIFKCCAFV